ncbi:MAG: entericidin A/B family lipoprotein [Rhodocyclaceae bacterium]
MKKVVYVLACMIAVVTLSACNTVAGFGKDVEHAGEAMQRGAKK